MERGTGAGVYHVSAADLDRDRDEIVELCSSVIDGFTAERYEKYFERNPCARPLAVVARSDAGQLVGVAALHLQEMELDGELLTVGVAGDFAVHPAHRVFGPALSLQRELTRMSRDGGVPLALGIPGDAAAGVMKRAGYSRVGSSVRLIRPLRLRDVPALQRRIGKTARGLHAALRSRAVAAALVGHSELECRSFDARLDALLATARRGVGLSLHRTPEFLNWRFEFDRSAEPSRFSIVAASRDGSPVAYAVSLVEDDVCRIVDLVWVDSAGLAAVVAGLIRRSRDNGLAAVDLFCFGAVADLAGVLAGLGFLAADGQAVWRPPVWCSRSEPLALEDPQRWLLFESAFDV